MSGNVTLSRREFLKLTGLVASATLLEACTLPSPSAAEVTTSPTIATVHPAATATALHPTTTATEPVQRMTITIIYNNIAHNVRLSTAWGFAALIEYGGEQVLFDAGGDSPTLLGNMAILEKDPSTIQQVVLSHIHDDHIGGLQGLLETGVRPTVYVPPLFSREYKDPVSEITELIEVEPGLEIASGMFTTGEVLGNVVEQSMILRSHAGLVVITGCAHPGIVKIVKRAKDLFNEPVFLAMGGFHLGNRNERQIIDILTDLRQLEVQQVAPSHCTGQEAIGIFAREYGDDFILSGAGTVITV
ncbi:MAG: MBL fold metallo-hydrolase [Chloroflexi bacterium]|nr:MBL fold metallo-hydrolase [Chloroflexota bacterium]